MSEKKKKALLTFDRECHRMQEPESKKPNRTHHTCSVAVCRSPKDASYHHFPKDEKLSKIWLNACKRKDFVNVKTALICSEHFHEAEFERDLMNELLNLPTRRKLKPGKSLSIWNPSFS